MEKRGQRGGEMSLSMLLSSLLPLQGDLLVIVDNYKIKATLVGSISSKASSRV